MLRPMRCSPTSEIRCWQRSRRPILCGSVWPWPGRFLDLDLLSHVCGHLSSTRSNSSRAPTRRPPLFSFYEPSLLSGLRATSFATTTCGCLEYFTANSDGDRIQLKGKSSIRFLQLFELVRGLLHWVTEKSGNLLSSCTCFSI